MTGYELRTSVIESVCSANWATTTAQLKDALCFEICLVNIQMESLL